MPWPPRGMKMLRKWVHPLVEEMLLGLARTVWGITWRAAIVIAFASACGAVVAWVAGRVQE